VQFEVRQSDKGLQAVDVRPAWAHVLTFRCPDPADVAALRGGRVASRAPHRAAL